MTDTLTLDEQRLYLLSKKGNPVRFKYPEGDFSAYPREGTLKDRFVILDSEDDFVVYWNIIDLIEFKDHPENWLRITYYRYKTKEMKWVFAGQTSISNPISGFVQMFSDAIKEKNWFKDFFKQIQKQCAEELDYRS